MTLSIVSSNSIKRKYNIVITIIQGTTVCPGSSDPFYKVTYYYMSNPRSSDPFYIVSYYMKWVPNSWTHSIYIMKHIIRNYNFVKIFAIQFVGTYA